MISDPFRGSRRALFVLLTASLLNLSGFAGIVAGAALVIDADRQFEFAEQYLRSGEYTRAVDEYKRFLYFFPDDSRADEARFKIGTAYFNGNDFESALHACRDLIRRSPGSRYRPQAYWMVGESHVKLGQYDQAVATLEQFAEIAENPELRDESLYRLGWIHMETASFEKARRAFGRIRPHNQTKFNVERVFAELDKEPMVPRKHPGLAGGLSLLPGAGYLYCERYRDALVAFLVNGALIFSTYAAADNDNPALAGILAFASLGFYGANIYGAVGSAHKYNRTKARDFIEQLKQNTRIHLSAERGWVLALRYQF